MSDDLDGVPYVSNSPPRSRGKRGSQAVSSKWEADNSVVTTSCKWDSLEAESELATDPPRKKFSRDHEDIFTDADTNRGGRMSDDDLDGTPFDDSSQDMTQHSSDSRFDYIRAKIGSPIKMYLSYRAGARTGAGCLGK